MPSSNIWAKEGGFWLGIVGEPQPDKKGEASGCGEGIIINDE